MRHLAGFIPLAALALALSGCSPRAAGVYTGGEDLLKMTVDLKANGNAYFTTVAGTQQGSYTMDGDKVVIKMEGTTTVFTLTPEGMLKGGPFGLELKRESKN